MQMDPTSKRSSEAPAVPRSDYRTANGGEARLVDTDRRRDDRIPLAIEVNYPQRNAFFFEYTRNISRGGMFVATNNPLEPGTRLSFEIKIPGEEEPVELVGEVRWSVSPAEVTAVKDPPPNLEAGMGIKFVFADEAEQEAFDERVRGMVIDAFGPDIGGQLLESF